MSDQPLALLLLRASRWFDRRLLDRLEELGWPRLTSAQSLVFPHLGGDGTSPAALARALGATRQSTQELVAGLVRLGLAEVVDDPATKRGRLVVLTSRGRDLASAARGVLGDLEAELGATRGAQLRDLLESVLDDGTAGR